MPAHINPALIIAAVLLFDLVIVVVFVRQAAERIRRLSNPQGPPVPIGDLFQQLRTGAGWRKLALDLQKVVTQAPGTLIEELGVVEQTRAGTSDVTVSAALVEIPQGRYVALTERAAYGGRNMRSNHNLLGSMAWKRLADILEKDDSRFIEKYSATGAFADQATDQSTPAVFLKRLWYRLIGYSLLKDFGVIEEGTLTFPEVLGAAQTVKQKTGAGLFRDRRGTLLLMLHLQSNRAGTVTADSLPLGPAGRDSLRRIFEKLLAF